ARSAAVTTLATELPLTLLGRSSSQRPRPGRLCRFVPGVAMVQSAQSRRRNHRRVCRRLMLDRSGLRRVLSQRVVKPVLMVIAHVIPKQAQKMTLVQSNNMIQELTAAASDPTLGDSILPRRLNARPLRFQTRRLQKRDDLRIEFRIPVE